MTNIYLPQAEDQLIITCDGARTPPAVGVILQARTPSWQIKSVRFYLVKLNSHVTKWFPCKKEAFAVGTAIEPFYDNIKISKKPVIICPDSKTVIDAANKIAKGHFSLSPRIQTFLNNLSKISYYIQQVLRKIRKKSSRWLSIKICHRMFRLIYVKSATMSTNTLTLSLMSNSMQYMTSIREKQQHPSWIDQHGKLYN